MQEINVISSNDSYVIKRIVLGVDVMTPFTSLRADVEDARMIDRYEIVLGEHVKARSP